jgi:hypothetical protein
MIISNELKHNLKATFQRLMMVVAIVSGMSAVVKGTNIYLEYQSYKAIALVQYPELKLKSTAYKGQASNLKDKFVELKEKYDDALTDIDYLNGDALLSKTRPYQPKLALSRNKEIACIALVIYGEERMGSPQDWIKTANVVYNRAGQKRFKPNSCEVITKGFDSMDPLLNKIDLIRRGKIDIYVPWSARQNKLEGIRWAQILEMSKRIVDGKEPLLTHATHFVSIKGLKRVPDWLRKLRPVGVTTGHFLFSDYELRGEERILYTAQRPYNQAAFNYRMD